MQLRIQIVSTGEFLVLSKDGTLTIELHTTLFNNQGSFLGSFSYPGQMPLEPNRAMLNNGHYISTNSKQRTFYVLMWLGYLPYKQVKMTYIIQADSGGGAIVQYNLYIDSTIINNQLSNLKLNRLALAGMSSQVNLGTPAALKAYMQSAVTAAPGAMPMTFFPFRDENAYKPVAGATMVFKGNYNASTNTPALHNAAGGALPAGVVAGWVYLINVAGAPDWGAGVVSCFLNQYVVYDGAIWYQTTNPYGIRVSGYSDLLFPMEPVINRWELDSMSEGAFKVDPGIDINNTQVPMFYLWFILKRVGAYFGCTVTGKVFEQEWFLRITIWSRIAITSYIIGDCTLYMPNISLTEFIQECRVRFGLLIDFDMTRMIMIVDSLVNLEATTQIADLRAKQLKSYREITNNTTYYVVTQTADGDDAAYDQSSLLPQLTIGDISRAITETDITLSSVITDMITETAAVDALLASPPLAEWKIPHIKQAIWAASPQDQVITVSTADSNNFKLRLLYFHGMQPDSNGHTYPFGSSDNLDVLGNRLSDFTLSLVPGPYDFQTMRFYYNFLLNSKPFEMGFELTITELLNLKANDRVLVKDPNNFATISALIDQVAADLSQNKELIPTKITLWPIVRPDNDTQLLPLPPVTPPVDNGLVYVRLEQRNAGSQHPMHPREYELEYVDLYASFWTDMAGTVPKPVTGLLVGLHSVETAYSSGTVTTQSYNTSCTGTEFLLAYHAGTSQLYLDGLPGDNNYVWTYNLIMSAYYTII